jgi:hypothetical protein
MNIRTCQNGASQHPAYSEKGPRSANMQYSSQRTEESSKRDETVPCVLLHFDKNKGKQINAGISDREV